MDISKRDALLKKVGDVNESPTAVSLEDFFLGNDDGGSIWCNLEKPISPDAVFAVLKTVRGRPGVSDVVVMVTQYDGGEEWPFSDRVYVFTEATPEDVIAWLGRGHAPDEWWSVNEADELEQLGVPAGMNVVGLWWD